MLWRWLVLGVMMSSATAMADGWGGTFAPNVNSIANTRHNLTLSYINPNASIMNIFRNQYLEICVYCHTPHAANGRVNAPLWNRARPSGTYTLYNQWEQASPGYDNDPSTYDQPVATPGPNSLSCLSCHDGSMSVDTVINMPSRPTGAMAGYAPEPNTSFLDQWDGIEIKSLHFKLTNDRGAQSCMACHAGDFPLGGAGRNLGFIGFQIAEATTELRNDHPIGVTYPAINTRPNPNQPPFPNVSNDYREPHAGSDSLGRVYYFFDRNGSGKLDKNEVRLYNSGDGPKVECTTCHDPHGIPSNGEGSEFIPGFLRVSNSGNERVGLCLTCHNK